MIRFVLLLFSFWMNPLCGYTQPVVPGVIITFDDTYVDEWVATDSIFQSQHWRATFFVSSFHKLTAAQKASLLQLQKNGNEIGFHGDGHLSALPFIAANSIAKYLEKDFTQVEPMRNYGLNVRSFAYPSGSRNAATDSVLLRQFSTLRSVTNKDDVEKNKTCFFNGNPLVAGIGIEYQYRYFSHEYLQNLLDYARGNNTILVVYGHRPVETPDRTKHEVAYETIRFICEYVNRNHMKFYTMSDLAWFSKK